MQRSSYSLQLSTASTASTASHSLSPLTTDKTVHAEIEKQNKKADETTAIIPIDPVGKR